MADKSSGCNCKLERRADAHDSTDLFYLAVCCSPWLRSSMLQLREFLVIFVAKTKAFAKMPSEKLITYTLFAIVMVYRCWRSHELRIFCDEKSHSFDFKKLFASITLSRIVRNSGQYFQSEWAISKLTLLRFEKITYGKYETVNM